MAKWKIIVSIVLGSVSIITSAAQSWLGGLLMLLIGALMTALYIFAVKKGSNLFIKIAYSVAVFYMLFATVFGTYGVIATIPNYLILSKWGMASMIWSLMSRSVPDILMLLGNIFPLIYCLRLKKEKSVG